MFKSLIKDLGFNSKDDINSINKEEKRGPSIIEEVIRKLKLVNSTMNVESI